MGGPSVIRPSMDQQAHVEVRAQSLCVCVIECAWRSGGPSSDRLKPLKENQSCHKRKVSSILLLLLFFPAPLILSLLFPRFPFFLSFSFAAKRSHMLHLFIPCLLICFLLLHFCFSATHTAPPGSGRGLHV